MLRQLEPGHLERVLREFDPPVGTTNMNGRLSAFIRAVQAHGSKVPAEDVAQTSAMSSFVAQWDLDAETCRELLDMPEAARAVIMRQFDPSKSVRDQDGACMLRSVIRVKASEIRGESRRTDPYQQQQKDAGEQQQQQLLQQQQQHLLQGQFLMFWG